MPLLVLMRHAKAVRDHEAPSDRARGLTARGRRDAGAALAALRESGMTPGRIVASSALRTRETAEIVAAGLSGGAPVFRDDLYLAESAAIWEALRPFGADGVMVVGHNPGLHDLVATLVRRSGDGSTLARHFLGAFATSDWAAFEVEDEPLGSAAAKLVAGFVRKGD